MDMHDKFKSFIAPQIRDWFIEQAAIGQKPSTIKGYVYTLRQFDEIIAANNEDGNSIVTEAMYEKWVSTFCSGIKTKNISRKIKVVQKLLDYMFNAGYDVFLPEKCKMHRVRESFSPYIFSKDEIERIFKATDTLSLKYHRNNSALISIPALVRLLYSTGMRIGEALNIRLSDIKWDKHCLYLPQTKNGKQRLSPLNKSLENVLRQYLKYRNRIPGASMDDDSYLFVNSKGERIPHNTFWSYHITILRLAGIKYLGGYKGPRVHDYRHTACCHAMVKLLQDGKDLYCTLPYISAFMGHTDYSATEKYLRLTQEMYPSVVNNDIVLNQLNLTIPKFLSLKNENDKRQG